MARAWMGMMVGGGLVLGCTPATVTTESMEEGGTTEVGDVTTGGTLTGALSGTGMTPTATAGTDTSGGASAGDDPDPDSATGPTEGSSSSDESSDDTGTADTGTTDTGTTDPGTTDTGTTDTGTTDTGTDTGTTDTGTTGEMCEDFDPIACDALDDDPSIFNAIGLGCEGDPAEVIPLVSSTFPPATDEESWGIATQFGTHLDAMGDPTWGPRHGETVLVLSSGAGVNPDDAGLLTFVTQDTDANDNPDGGPLPAPIVSAVSANDLVWFQVELAVPAGVTGFSLDMAFFSEEFPEWVGTTFNDALIVWAQTSTSSVEACIPAGGGACTVTALWPVMFGPGDVELAGTGFHNDGGTGWQTLRAPTDPGDTLVLTVAVHDAGDSGGNTIALLDAFSWECDGCDGTPGNECGLGP